MVASERIGDSEIKPYEAQIEGLDIYKSYKKSPYLSIKHSSYFQAYTDLLDGYRGREIAFVEIGVLNGGSLFMWRDYFGPKARIIGIDLNPDAKRWESEGFEIHIGNQADPEFWAQFFRAVGLVDVVLDDGGHTFEQQIVTAHACIPYIKDGGLLVVEDTHTSYFEEFGYPSKYSFMEWVKKLIDNVNSRSPRVKASSLPYKEAVYSISIFESIVGFKIQRNNCRESVPTSNDGITSEAQDYRHRATASGAFERKVSSVASRFGLLKKVPLFKAVKALVLSFVVRWDVRWHLRRLRRFFE